jgi:hypothetical protein
VGFFTQVNYQGDPGSEEVGQEFIKDGNLRSISIMVNKMRG